MKAATYSKYGRADVICIKEVDKPVPKKDEVLIEIHAATVNRTDEGFRRANYFVSRVFTGLMKPKREVWGSEFAGKIVAVGSGVKNFKQGDRVFGFDDVRGAAHAEYMVARDDGPMAIIPGRKSYRDMAPAGEGASYALNVIESAKTTRGQKIMVYGASGAIGSAAVQILKHRGAHVTAVCGKKNLKVIKSLGADRVIDYQAQDFTSIGEKFDLVFDAVGKSTYGACKHLLAPRGQYYSSELGFALQNPLLALWFAITGSRRVIFPLPKINKEIVEKIRKLVEADDYRPLIDRTYSLDDIVAAAKYVETGQKTGNVVIDIKHID